MKREAATDAVTGISEVEKKRKALIESCAKGIRKAEHHLPSRVRARQWGYHYTPALLDAVDPFRQVLAIIDALPGHQGQYDDQPLRAHLPGIWPAVGELRALVKAANEARKERAA